ncbi:MAG TPA: hypothetical protein PLA82_08930 [Deltaproteobacteria bacterium]|nr:hypothetical protein [Deltaproteobacteria bacterium]
MDGALIIDAAVEGIIDEAVAQKLIVGAGGSPGTIYGKTGKAFLYQKIQGFNNAAKTWPWLVLVDLDNDKECAPPFCTRWVPDPSPYLCFRVAVREVESWLMADSETLASFLGISRAIIPKDPEGLVDPKREMVNLARRSRKEAIRKDMVPRQGSGRPVGPAYASRMIEYVQNYWRPEVAARRADSLGRAIACLRRVIKEVVA